MGDWACSLSNCLTVGRIVSVKLRHHAKFRGDWSNRCRDTMILNFYDGGSQNLKFLHFYTFNRPNGQEGRTASLCQISSKSLEPRLRCGYFSIFQDGGRRHLGLSKFRMFNGQNGQEGRTTPACQISSTAAILDF